MGGKASKSKSGKSSKSSGKTNSSSSGKTSSSNSKNSTSSSTIDTSKCSKNPHTKYCCVEKKIMVSIDLTEGPNSTQKQNLKKAFSLLFKGLEKQAEIVGEPSHIRPMIWYSGLQAPEGSYRKGKGKCQRARGKNTTPGFKEVQQFLNGIAEKVNGKYTTGHITHFSFATYQKDYPCSKSCEKLGCKVVSPVPSHFCNRNWTDGSGMCCRGN